jgi:inward rectifier potassium channel
MVTAGPTIRPRPAAQISGGRPQIVRLGVKRFTWGDLYHVILTMRWSLFFGGLVAAHVTANLIFAGLYMLERVPNIASATSFIDYFYFSVQTWATVGYGALAPTTTYANMLMVFESICAICGSAVTTGLVFAKFARPTARVLFANNMVIHTLNGKPTLMLRVANERGNDVVEASARITLLRDEKTLEGDTMRRLYDLKLVRDVQPVFAISWTLMHIIDEESPFFGKTGEDIVKEGWQVVVNITGHDGTLSQTMYASHFYRAPDIVFGAKYVDVMARLPDGRLQIDLKKFHDVTVPSLH